MLYDLHIIANQIKGVGEIWTASFMSEETNCNVFIVFLQGILQVQQHERLPC
jgi:hypothetical protein